jgi:MFS family permease
MPYRLLLVICAGFFSASSYWMFLPLLSLSLRAEGASDAMVGLMSGLPWAGLLLVSPFIPRIIHRIGLQRMVLTGMALSIAVFLGFASTRNIPLWGGLTLLLGVSLGLRWAGLDTWINGSVPEHLRGRLIGAFELIMSGAMAMGPAVLAMMGSEGSRPFLAAAAVVCGAMVLLSSTGREASGIAEDPGTAKAWHVLRAEPASYVGIGIVGMAEACNLSLLPVMGLGLGTVLHRAAMLVVICQIGVALGSFGCGTLADHLNRRALKIGAAVVMAILPLAVPLTVHGGAIWPVLAIWGAAQGGMFTVAMVKLGSRFSDTALARAMSLSMVIYTLGGIAGPPAMGAMMAIFGPPGLVYGLAALAALGAVFIALKRAD